MCLVQLHMSVSSRAGSGRPESQQSSALRSRPGGEACRPAKCQVCGKQCRNVLLSVTMQRCHLSVCRHPSQYDGSEIPLSVIHQTASQRLDRPTGWRAPQLPGDRGVTGRTGCSTPPWRRRICTPFGGGLYSARSVFQTTIYVATSQDVYVNAAPSSCVRRHVQTPQSASSYKA